MVKIYRGLEVHTNDFWGFGVKLMCGRDVNSLIYILLRTNSTWRSSDNYDLRADDYDVSRNHWPHFDERATTSLVSRSRRTQNPGPNVSSRCSITRSLSPTSRQLPRLTRQLRSTKPHRQWIWANIGLCTSTPSICQHTIVTNGYPVSFWSTTSHESQDLGW